MAKKVIDRCNEYLAAYSDVRGWNRSVADVLAQAGVGRKVDGDQLVPLLQMMASALPHLAGSPDRLQYASPRMPPTLDLWFRSERFGVDIGMGLNFRDRCVYLASGLVTPAPLWRVAAEFWERMSLLARYADDVTYEPSGVAPQPQDPSAACHLLGSKCALFQLIAQYALLKSADASPEPAPGLVIVSWSWGTAIEPLLCAAAECFAKLERMNWLLHRINYLDGRARSRSDRVIESS
jgi:hypothetical protein